MHSEILTRAQLRQCLTELRRLVDLPEVQDLINDILLGEYSDGGSISCHWGKLYLTPKGLLEKSGYIEGKYDLADNRWSKYLDDPDRIVEANEDLIERYELSLADLSELIRKLQA